MEERLGHAHGHPADVIQREPVRRLVPVQGVDVQPVLQVPHDPLDRPGGVLDDEPHSPGQIPSLSHPAHHRLNVL